MIISTKEQIDHANKIWGRARANAFAHRYAAEKYDCQSKILFLSQLILGLSSLFLVIFLYAIISGDDKVATGKTPLVVTLVSVIYTMMGLGIGVMQNYIGYEQKQISHYHNHHSFLYLAQRAREIEAPGFGFERGQSLIEDLERDFQILKVRGQEPTDRDFRLGHSVLKGVSESSLSSLQSFQLITSNVGIINNTNSTPQEKNTIRDKAKNYETSWQERHPCIIIIFVLSLFYLASVCGTYFLTGHYLEMDRNPVPAHTTKTAYKSANQTLLGFISTI